jgi:hypothetical protein
MNVVAKAAPDGYTIGSNNLATFIVGIKHTKRQKRGGGACG